MTTNRLEPGTILGAYEILGFIAEGGMGSVYRARNRILGDLRAVKVILPSLSSNQEFVARFVREAQLAARVSHPNVVKMLEPAMDGALMFLPMELLEGESLSDLAKREAPLHPTRAIDLMIPVCAGLHALHQVGIIHRDVKPANVFLANDDAGNLVPKLIDLGAARDVDSGEQTNTGAVIGSAHYMPIEQAAGRKDIDLRVDIYALGVMLYLLLTRKRPYENDETGVAMAKVLQGAAFAPPREVAPWIPVELERVVLAMMAREREHRPSSALDVADLLGSVRPLCEGVALPPPVRQRHVTAGISISQPAGLREPSGIRDPNSIRSRGLPSGESTNASMVQGVATPIAAPPASRSKAPLVAGLVALVLAVSGAGAFALLRRPPAEDASGRGANGQQHAATRETEPQTTVPAPLAQDASVQATPTVEPSIEADAASNVALTEGPEAGTQPAAPRVDRPTRTTTPGGTTRVGRVRPGGCVPRPGIPCL
jgi:serine/threonine protein kinase